MKIGIITTHSFPIPYKTHTGDICILDLAHGLKQLGHEVVMFAPQGTDWDKVYPMRCSYGKFPPFSQECEIECFDKHRAALADLDVVHDFSVTKFISQIMNMRGQWNTCATMLGGPWQQENEPHNLIVWSNSHADRVLRGATDYEGTPTPFLGGAPGKPVREVRVVNGGIDTGFYCPDKYVKGDYFLWLNRWHEPRGFKFAIELAKQTGIKLKVVGEHPDHAVMPPHRDAAIEARKLAEGWDNISIEYLLPDPDHHTSKREWYRGARALLYPTQFCDPFGLSQVEALSCGTPVIGTNYGSVPEIIKPHVGFVCDNSVDSFAAAIARIDEIDPVDCRKYATGNFSRQLFAKRCEALYQRIIAGESW